MVKVRQQLVPNRLVNRVISKGTNGRKWITIHDTGNLGRGANAQVHANLQSRGNTRKASWHYQVDDKEAIQSFLDTTRCWHAGDGNGNGNMNSIGIETCINSDGNYRKAVENTIELTKHLMKKYNIPASRVVRHRDWDGKYCPRQLMNGKDGLTWGWFKSQLTGKPSTVKVTTKSNNTTAGAKLIKNEDAYFLVTENIKVRNQPTTKAKHTGTLSKGASINYKRVFEGNGYRWLEYIGNSGNTLYLPYRPSGTNKKQWGTFHASRPNSAPKRKTVDQMAREVIDGKHGVGHENRRKSLGISEAEYQKVRRRVNQLI